MMHELLSIEPQLVPEFCMNKLVTAAERDVCWNYLSQQNAHSYSKRYCRE